MTDVKIVMTGHGRGQVFIDGVEVQATQVNFTAAMDEPNRVQFTLLAETVSIEGPASVVRQRLPWWKRVFGPSPFDRVREGPTRSQMKRHGSNGPPPRPPPPPPPNPPAPRDVRKP